MLPSVRTVFWSRFRQLGSIMEFSHVFFKIKVSTEAFSTDVTCKWFFVVVRVHVERQVVHLGEKTIKLILFKFEKQ